MFEKLIEVLVALTAALNANTAAILKGSPVTTETATPATEEPKKGRKPKADTPPPAPTTPPAENPAPAPTTPVTPAAPVPTVQDVRAIATKLMDANNNEDEGLFAKINTKYGTKRISEVPETARAEVIAEIAAKLAEVEAKKKAGANAI